MRIKQFGPVRILYSQSGPKIIHNHLNPWYIGIAIVVVIVYIATIITLHNIAYAIDSIPYYLCLCAMTYDIHSYRDLSQTSMTYDNISHSTSHKLHLQNQANG